MKTADDKQVPFLYLQNSVSYLYYIYIACTCQIDKRFIENLMLNYIIFHRGIHKTVALYLYDISLILSTT